MIIIGVRSDENGRKYYLLQNWWKEKQFVEIDYEYLKVCQPTLYYVKTPQTKIPDEFPTDLVRFSENENIDKPESYPDIEGPLKGVHYHNSTYKDTKN